MIRATLDDRAEKIYALVLKLYPRQFREAYAIPMRRAFRDAWSDGALSRCHLLNLVAKDLITSLIKEYLKMFRETYARPALIFNAVILAGISTGIALALYAIPQQVLRNGANDPQIQMATDLAARLDRVGVTNGLHQGAHHYDGGVVDISQSLSPFLIVYDDQGRALGSNAQLNGITPVPPGGVFEYVRSHGEERVSWQPVRGSQGVRIAAIIERVNGPVPGFVLAGRSLREVEAREAQVRQMAGVTWVGMIALIVIGTLVYGWMTRPQVERFATSH